MPQKVLGEIVALGEQVEQAPADFGRLHQNAQIPCGRAKAGEKVTKKEERLVWVRRLGDLGKQLDRLGFRPTRRKPERRAGGAGQSPEGFQAPAESRKSPLP